MWGGRFESKNKMKISPLIRPRKKEVSVKCSHKAINLTENNSLLSSVVSAEPARVQAKVEFDLDVQKIEYQGNTNFIYLAEFKLKEGSRTKIAKSLDLTFLIKLFWMIISLYFSTSGADDFRANLLTWSKHG